MCVKSGRPPRALPGEGGERGEKNETEKKKKFQPVKKKKLPPQKNKKFGKKGRHQFSFRAARQHRGAGGTGHARPVQHDLAGVVAKKKFDSAALRAGLGKSSPAQLGMEIKLRATEPGRRQRFAIFVTKEPQCFETLATAVAKKSIVADPVLVIGNHASFGTARKKVPPAVHLRAVGRPRESRTEGAEIAGGTRG